MITAADSDYHPSDPAVKNWAETIVLVFSVPEAGILGNAYVLARPNVGAAISAVVVSSGFCTQPFQIDFTDPQVHVPAPEKFSEFVLPTGLGIEVTDAPRNFHVQYKNELGSCRLDLRFAGLHDPFDVHDPAQNPLVAPGHAGPLDTGLGDVWANGHFDMIGHITGTLELRGVEYAVDCVEGMDRSWGPRAELGNSGASWIHVSLGPGFAAHLAMSLDIRQGQVIYQSLKFGYVVEDGELYGITHATVESARVDMIAVTNHLAFTDVRGKQHEFYGSAVGGAPWHSFSPAYVSYQSLMRYQIGDRVGYAEQGDIFGLEFLAERMSRHGRNRT